MAAGFAPFCLAADSNTSTVTPKVTASTNAASELLVTNYEIKGDALLPAEASAALLSKYTGTNVALTDIVKAAAELQSEYRQRGYPTVSIAIAGQRITNGIVTLNLFRGDSPQILVSGRRYSTNGEPALALHQPAATNTPAATGVNAATTAANTNSSPKFLVSNYEIKGDTLLSTDTLMSIFTKYTGTNITVSDVVKAASELQLEYRNRGFPTVNVTLPPQQITNGIVKIRVFVGLLSEIDVTGNRFFSSNNVMRALPSLETNLILSTPVLQAELDRVNGNQDRQIYPQIEPGEVENTTRLRLEVRDRLPLHAKVELNNQSSPGTPELRVNTSAVYNNLWQYEHSLGVQYSFSPEQMKSGGQWDTYDRPLVANYSGFYRLPLGNPEAISDVVATSPGNFGYDEATRKFRLPPPSAGSELSFYASRSTIDTGLETLSARTILDVPGVRTVTEKDVQQDITINESIGSRLSGPIPEFLGIRSTLSAGLDFKSYDLTDRKTNNFSFSEITLDQNGNPNPPTITDVPSPVPTTHKTIKYLMLSARWNASRQDASGTTSLGLGYNGNLWFSGIRSNLQSITGSKNSRGDWIALNANIARDQMIATNWILAMRADAQWASEPLIGNEQFGVGGVASVRGYREGEVFGDTGWCVSLEQKTPPHVVGLVNKSPLTVRGSIFMDYGEIYLLDPTGRKDRVPLWGVGFGGVVALGTHWEARFLFSWPLLGTATTEPYQPRFDFGLSAQF